VDTATVNNTYPTRVTLLLLGMFQAGVVLLVEPLGHRLVAGARAWAVVVVVNARIMTLYLWHVTAMVAVIGVSLLAGGWGLGVEPLTATWWLTRPAWYVALGIVTTGLVALLGRFESSDVDPRPAPAWWRPLVAVVGVCAGLGALAVLGIAGADGLHGWLLVVPLVSLALGGVVRLPRFLRRR
jgi:hypothetical protein